MCLARRTIDYPPTKVAFGPGNAPPAGTFEGQPESERHFIATSSDALRIYVYHNVVEQVEAKGQYVGQSHYKRTGKLTREIKYPKVSLEQYIRSPSDDSRMLEIRWTCRHGTNNVF